MSSGAAYLTIAADDSVFEIVFSLGSSIIPAIPKSQICGSPLSAYSQLLFCERGRNDLPLERQVRYSVRLQSTAIERTPSKTHTFDCEVSDRA